MTAYNNDGVVIMPGEEQVLATESRRLGFLATGQDTSGSFSVIHFTMQPGFVSPPLHRHHTFDEAFYVLNGILTVQIGEQTVNAPSGAFILVPRMAFHTISSQGIEPTMFLQIISPAGFEKYYEELAQLLPPKAGQTETDVILALFKKYDTELAKPAGLEEI